jgi:DNA-binding Lrp family transcriptional regulator
MPKSSVKQIEKDKKKILDELAKNANKSINDIATSCGFSRQKVWRVINNLEKNHTIWGYTAVVDEEKLGKKSYILLIKRSNKPMTGKILEKMSRKDFMKRVEKLGIESLYHIFINGNYDWIISFNASDIKVAKGYVEELNRTYEGYIGEILLQEIMFSAQSSGMINPNIEKLKDFFKV